MFTKQALPEVEILFLQKGMYPSPAQLIMDIEGFTEYHELINFLNNGQFDELQFKNISLFFFLSTFAYHKNIK